MFIKYKEEQENTYYNLVLYKKDNQYRIYTLKIETSKKLYGKGTTASEEILISVKPGMIPLDGWVDSGDDSTTGGGDYEYQCRVMGVEVDVFCTGAGTHTQNDLNCDCEKTIFTCKRGYTQYKIKEICEYVWVGEGDAPNNSGNTGTGNTGNGGGTGTSDTGNPIDVKAVNPNDVIPEGVDPIEWFEEKIEDNNLKPCLKAILNDLKNINTGVGRIITKFSGSTPGFNWEVKDSTLSGKTGQTKATYDRLNKKVTTAFDSQAWTNASDLSWARTILHESVHAYIVASFGIDYIQSKKTFADMFKDFIDKKYLNLNDAQHAEIVRNYVEDISASLQEYGTNKGYSLSAQFYNDLSWGGLTEWTKKDSSGNPIYDSLGNKIYEQTPWFISTFPNSSDKNRVKNNILIELTKKDNNGNTKTPKGKNAGC